MVNSSLKAELFDGEKMHIKKLNCHNMHKKVDPEIYKIITETCFQLAENELYMFVLLENILSKLLDISQSEIGSVSVIIENSSSIPLENKTLKCIALGEKPIEIVHSDECKLQTMKVDSLFGEAILSNKVIITNDFSKDPRRKHTMPESHPMIKNFMSFPLKSGGRMVGVLAISNSKTDYSFKLANSFLPLIKICGKMADRAVSNRESLAFRVRKSSELDKAKDRFLATMSHELRTPLNGVMGMAILLPEAGPLNEKQNEYVGHLIECSTRLANLLNNILDFSKMASNRFTLQLHPIDINEVINDSIKIFEGSIRAKNLKLKVDVADGIPSVIGDGQRIVQILSNLIGNSCKFTDKGYISVKVKAKKIKSEESLDNKIHINRWKIIFTVKDTGIGIPEDEQDKIFKMFHQSASLGTYLSKSGTGLGLSIARELVRLMGGKISVKSKGVKNQGAEFTFFIISDESIDISLLEDEYSETIKDAKILIVDDRPEIRLKLLSMLFEWKCSGQAVSSADEALQYLRFGMKFDVILVDICMPHMSGVELAQTLRCEYPDIPLIGISSAELTSGENYFDHYMYKPINRNQLFMAIIDCLMKPPQVDKIITNKKTKSNVRILIAEDDEHNIYTLNEMLQVLGYNSENIFISKDGQECVKIVKESKTPFDVILMDIVMPKMDGIEATRIIKTMYPKLMIIAISAAVQDSDKARCQRVGIDGYLAKPMTKNKLDVALSPLILES